MMPGLVNLTPRYGVSGSVDLRRNGEDLTRRSDSQFPLDRIFHKFVPIVSVC